MLIYFQSKAGGDFLMLEEHARILLGLMGKDFTPQGIITSNDISKNLIILQNALLAHELQQAKQLANEVYEQAAMQENIENTIVVNTAVNTDLINDLLDEDIDKLDKEKYNEPPTVTLKQRSWPLINIMNRANLKKYDILWCIQ